MKVTLEFDGFEDRDEMLQAVHAGEYVSALDEVDHMLRRYWKTDEQRGVVNKIWAEWCEIRADLPGEV